MILFSPLTPKLFLLPCLVSSSITHWVASNLDSFPLIQFILCLQSVRNVIKQITRVSLLLKPECRTSFLCWVTEATSDFSPQFLSHSTQLSKWPFKDASLTVPLSGFILPMTHGFKHESSLWIARPDVTPVHISSPNAYCSSSKVTFSDNGLPPRLPVPAAANL